MDLEAKFAPNILNTTVYIISMSLQVSTFAVNYKVSQTFSKQLYTKNMFDGQGEFEEKRLLKYAEYA